VPNGGNNVVNQFITKGENMSEIIKQEVVVEQVITEQELKTAGVNTGHQARTWNPKIKPYLGGKKGSYLIFNLAQQVELINEAYKKIYDVVQQNGVVLFVGTKKNVSQIIKDQATRVDAFYVSDRWLGGTLTNYSTIFNSVSKLNEIEERLSNAEATAKISKKEVLSIQRKAEKLKKNLGGIRNMTSLPQLIILVDPNKEINACLEARKLNIPIVGLVNTYSNPELVDYVIPGNDTLITSVELVIKTLADAVWEAKGNIVEHVKIDAQDVEVTPDAEETYDDQNEEEAPEIEEVPEIEEAPEQEDSLSKLSLTELKRIAKENGIKGYSSLKKEELVKLIKEQAL